MTLIPDSLELYQVQIQPDTLYYVKNSGRGSEREDSAIEVKGGTVNIYGSINNPASAPGGMTQDRTDFAGIDVFAYVPTFFYVETASGSPEVYLSSIEVEEVV